MDPAIADKNLASIQRIDPCASAILDKATHAAVYKFKLPEKSWEKTDVDGALFVYQRVDKPYYSFIIANRQSLSDLIEPVNPNVKLMREDQYIFFYKPDGIISGIWFFKSEDCARIYALLERLQQDLKDGKVPETPAPEVPVAQPPSTDGKQLLDLFKTTQSASSGAKTPVKTSSDPQTASGAQRKILFPPSKSNTVPEIVSPAVAGPEKAIGATVPGVESMSLLLNKLMLQEQPGSIAKAPSTMMSSEELEKDLLRTAKPKNAITLADQFVNSPSAASLAAFSARSVCGSEAGPDANEVDSSSSSAVGDTKFLVGSGPESPPLLNKDQFISAIRHLMATDDEFVSQIHQAYVDALNRRLRK